MSENCCLFNGESCSGSGGGEFMRKKEPCSEASLQLRAVTLYWEIVGLL